MAFRGLAVLLALAVGIAARRCPLLHAPESAVKTGCYVLVLYKETPQEKFDELVETVRHVAEENKLYGVTRDVLKAISVKLSPEALHMVSLLFYIYYTHINSALKLV